MSIELSQETVVTLSQATRLVPILRGRNQICPATVYRWASRGVRGIKLETIRVGGTLCTSVEAIQRFCDRLTNVSSDPAIERLTTACQRAERHLNQHGV